MNANQNAAMTRRLELFSQLSDAALAEMLVAAILTTNERSARNAVEAGHVTFDCYSIEPTIVAVPGSYLADNCGDNYQASIDAAEERWEAETIARRGMIDMATKAKNAVAANIPDAAKLYTREAIRYYRDLQNAAS